MRNRDAPDGGRLPDRLLRFAEIAESDSPLYARICRGITTEPAALEILAHAPHGQPAANLLLGAVHALLLSGTEHPLAEHYATMGGTARPDSDPVPDFVAFCDAHTEQIIELVTTRTVQTNEVRRCTTILPTLAHVAAGRQISLIEIGPGMGLNLAFDRYRYDYGDGILAGRGDSPLTLSADLRGARDLPLDLPPVVWRRGLDLEPLDVTDPDDVAWATALLWPEHTERVDRLRAAIDIVRDDPPEILRGDAVHDVGPLVAAAPPDSTPVIVHSFVLYQLTEGERSRFGDVLAAAGRPVDRISIETLSRAARYPEIVHTHYGEGPPQTRVLGSAHYHGEWVKWEG